MSERNQRLGELAGVIQVTQQRLVERAEKCKHLQAMVDKAQLDSAELDVAIGWHKTALQEAEERGTELEADQRKLAEGSGQEQKGSLGGDDLKEGASVLSARSETSTTTGGTVVGAPVRTGAFAPLPGLRPGLEPLAPHC